MEYKSEQTVEITMSDVASSDDEDAYDVEDNKFEIHTENACLVNTKTDPDEENLDDNNMIIKTENIKQEINTEEDVLMKAEFEDTILMKTEENNNEDILSNQINVLIKQEIDDMEFSDNYFKRRKSDDEDVNVDQINLAEKLNHSPPRLENDKNNKRTSKTKKSNHKLIRCEDCDYTTTKKNSFKRHERYHKDPYEQIWYHCTECSYKTMQRSHLRRHDMVHKPASEMKYFTCAICEYKFKQKCTLRRHIKDVHCTNTSKPNPFYQELFECAQCPYTTSRKGLLVTHMDKHKDVQYICDICSFSTKYRRNLRVHLEIHGKFDLLIHECNICKFQTRMGYCLRRHFLSKKHLAMVGKLNEYCPRPLKMKEDV
ncbi:unnamed protein product [Ceutorhynchus assimilis]|uniref:C2H2-type domain-containing protein n=1 Tax=Ceutorhynchus assimilis TaxID=467358 RepID=A0A9N9MTE6_9CUCU|nr:unnamed protein product [Ceutorhynchus assimilis]